jgi:hypothetical protein
MTEPKKFEIGNISMDGISDADLLQEESISFLRAAGHYNFEGVSITPAKEPKKDAAGNRWHGMRLLAKTVVDGAEKHVSSFIDIPVDSLKFTKKNGETSMKVIQVSCKLLSVILGREITTANVIEELTNIESTFVGGKFGARVSYKGDYIAFDKSAEAYAILTSKGDRDALIEQYRQLNDGRAPKQGLEFSVFTPLKAEAAVVNG